MQSSGIQRSGMKSQASEEKLRILSLSDDSRKLIQTLSNETSIRILKVLKSGNMSVSELAGRLDLRLNTLQYNLDSLLEADLIRVSGIKWSRKGREIKVYEPVEQMIVLIPPSRAHSSSGEAGCLANLSNKSQ